MGFNARSERRIADQVVAAESRPIRRPPPAPPALVRHLERWAIVRTTITARVGRRKGKGTVDILCDKGDGTGDDEILEEGVTIWNGTLTTIVPSSVSGKDRQVLVASIDGLLQVAGGDCPVTS